MTLSLLLLGAALAAPRDIAYTGPVEAVPVISGSFEDMAESPQCLKVDTRGMPMVQPCPPSIKPLFSTEACNGDFLCLAKARPSEMPAAWGIQSFDPRRAGADGTRNYMATDHVFTRQVAYLPADATALDDATLSALVSLCSNSSDRQIVIDVHLGCGKTLRLDGYSPAEGPLKLRDRFDTTTSRGDGSFLTDRGGPDTSSCTGAEQVMAVETLSLAEVCSTQVFPESLDRMQAELSTFKAQPDAVQEDRLSLLMDLNLVQTGHRDLLANIDRLVDRLTGVRRSLGFSREAFEDLKVSDNHLQALLTELERLSSEIAESFNALAHIKEKADAYADEAKALEEKASISFDGYIARSLQREVAAVLKEGRALHGEFVTRRKTIDDVARDVGFLEGRIAEVREAR